MIAAELRDAVLRGFPPGTSLVVLDAAAELELGTLRGAQNVFLSGLEDAAAPADVLTAIRKAAPGARLFALVQNAASLRALAELYAGSPAAAGHPLVRAELEPLFRAAGWSPLTVDPLEDESFPAPSAFPVEIGTPAGLVFRFRDAETLARARALAYVVIADPA